MHADVLKIEGLAVFYWQTHASIPEDKTPYTSDLTT
jgi:hypothetical protein